MPVREQSDRSRSINLLRLPNSAGIDPVSSGLPYNSRYCSSLSCPRDAGIVPVREQSDGSSSINLLRLPNSAGIDPVSSGLPYKYRNCRLPSWPSEAGIVPATVL